LSTAPHRSPAIRTAYGSTTWSITVTVDAPRQRPEALRDVRRREWSRIVSSIPTSAVREY
jgi:hypothetical protein